MISFYLILLPLLQAPIEAQEIQNWEITRFQRSAPMGTAESVMIKNVYGDIRTRATDEKNLLVSAVIQRHRADPDRSEIVINNTRRQIVIEVRYPAHTVEKHQEKAIPSRRRVDISVFVPDQVPLHVRTSRGLIESKGHKGRLEIETQKGNVIVFTKGTVDARSQSGRIRAVFKNRSWKESSRFETVTGDISVELAGKPDLLARIDTGGDITTDYSINIHPYPGSTRKRGEARIGAGGPTLSLTSRKGSVRLKRIIDMIPTLATGERESQAVGIGDK